MSEQDDLIKKADLEKIAKQGQEIYDKIKVNYLPKDRGKFLAIDIDSEDVFLGVSSSEALESARKKYPDKVFFVVKIGYDITETMAILARQE